LRFGPSDAERGEKTTGEDAEKPHKNLTPWQRTGQNSGGVIHQVARFAISPDTVIFHSPTKTL
jgi:hypothetical protein